MLTAEYGLDTQPKHFFLWKNHVLITKHSNDFAIHRSIYIFIRAKANGCRLTHWHPTLHYVASLFSFQRQQYHRRVECHWLGHSRLDRSLGRQTRICQNHFHAGRYFRDCASTRYHLFLGKWIATVVLIGHRFIFLFIPSFSKLNEKTRLLTGCM